MAFRYAKRRPGRRKINNLLKTASGTTPPKELKQGGKPPAGHPLITGILFIAFFSRPDMTVVNEDENHEKGSDIDDPQLPLTEHLRELRKRMVYIFSCMLVVFLGAWGVSNYIVDFIQAPVVPFVKNLQFDTLTDPFFTHLKAAFYASVFLTFPFTLGQLWLFVGPALYKKEKKVMWPFMLLSYPLFVGGGLFCYFIVFPFAVEFLINFDKTLVPSLRIGDYLSFVLRLIFVFGMVFEMPLLSLLLTRMGLLTPEFLRTNRRYAIVVVFVVAAILTPPDAFTQMLLAGPLLVLYELSVLVSWMARPKDDPDDPEAAA